MQRDPRAFLWDVRESTLAIQGFIAGMTSADYAANDLVQAGVERKFRIVGEALNQLARVAANRCLSQPIDLRLRHSISTHRLECGANLIACFADVCECAFRRVGRKLIGGESTGQVPINSYFTNKHPVLRPPTPKLRFTNFY